jgi:HlyD family secretion protein
MKKFILGVLGGLIVAVVLLAAIAPIVVSSGALSGIGGKREEATKVRVVGVERGRLVRTINAPGEIEPETRVEISAQVSARIVELPFDEGDAVKPGDVVVRLDDRDLTAALDAARSQMLAERARLIGAEAELGEARADAARQSALFETKDASQATLDTAQARLRRAESTIEQIGHAIAIAEARIRQAEKDLDSTVIRSPIAGVVTRLQAEVGELVVVGTLNSPGSVILEIADLSRMIVKARIDEANVSLVHAGQPATVYLNAFPDRAFTGTVTFVRLMRDLWRDGSGYVQADILVDADETDRLQTGLTANADIQVAMLDDVIKVPSQAVLDRRVEELPEGVRKDTSLIDATRTYATVVYVMTEEGKASVRPVRIGSSDLTHTVIEAGVEGGERVIAGPFKVLGELKDDQAVALEADAESDGSAAIAGGEAAAAESEAGG